MDSGLVYGDYCYTPRIPPRYTFTSHRFSGVHEMIHDLFSLNMKNAMNVYLDTKHVVLYNSTATDISDYPQLLQTWGCNFRHALCTSMCDKMMSYFAVKIYAENIPQTTAM